MSQTGHRRKRVLRKIVFRGLLAVGIVALVGGFAGFVYHAHAKAVCSDANSDFVSSGTWLKPGPGDCLELVPEIERDQRLDAIAFLLGLLMTTVGGLALTRAHRRTRRMVLIVAAIVVAVGVVYILLLSFGGASGVLE
jgi:hypothetical protein